jgi:hypothetical protein
VRFFFSSRRNRKRLELWLELTNRTDTCVYEGTTSKEIETPLHHGLWSQSPFDGTEAQASSNSTVVSTPSAPVWIDGSQPF